MICEVYRLGHMSYAEAWALQDRLVEQRGRDEIPDCLLLVEHPHTYTFGSAGHAAHLLMSQDELGARGIDVFHVDRGGDITYHGPGQVVGYPILRLAQPARAEVRADVVGYVRALETIIIRTLERYGVAAGVIPGLTGVWVGDAKIAAIGVRVTSRMVTKHGFAVNLNTDLGYYDGIIPCGIRDKSVTRLSASIGAPIDADAFCSDLSEVFGSVLARTMLQRTSSPSP